MTRSWGTIFRRATRASRNRKWQNRSGAPVFSPAGCARRKAEKQRRLLDSEQQTEQQLDAILAKVHERGLTSLTPAEKRLLKRASNRYRSKDTESE